MRLFFTVAALLFSLTACAAPNDPPAHTSLPVLELNHPTYQRHPEWNVLHSSISRIMTYRKSGQAPAWSPSGQWVAYSAKGADGYYDIHLAAPDGSRDINLTDAIPGLPKTHIGIPSWHPSERYLLVTVEKAEHPGSSFEALPGFAGYTDIWLVTTNGNHAYALTNVPNDPDHGVLFAHFSPDGKRVVWSERVKRPNFLSLSGAFGKHAIKVADFVESPTPRLINVQTFQPGGEAFYETYGFSPDGERILFCSSMDRPSVWEQQIYTMDAKTGTQVQALTQTGYNEHATYSTDGTAIVWMSNEQSGGPGTDWWIMKSDGNHKRRLTFFNQPGHPHYLGTVWAGGGSFSPNDRYFIGGIETSLLTHDSTMRMLELDRSKPTSKAVR